MAIPVFLTLPTVRKLFREDFLGRTPIRIERRELPELVQRWQADLGSIDGVHVTYHPGDRDSRSRTLCRFTVPDPHVNRHQWRSDEVRLEYDDADYLQLAVKRRGAATLLAPVSSLDEIKTFVHHVQTRYSRSEAVRRKQARLREFKSKAIVAQVRKLAQQHRFDFAVKVDTAKLTLFVRWNDSDTMELTIPFDRFEKVLPQLSSAVESFRRLQSEGVRFKTSTPNQRTADLDWICVTEP